MKHNEEHAVKTSLLSEVSTEAMAAKLSEYQKANAPLAARSSRLDPYKKFIEKLYLDSYSHGQIADFLITIGVSVHSTTVGRFIAKKINGIPSGRDKNRNSISAKLDNKEGEASVGTQLNDLKRPKNKAFTYSPFNNENSKEN